MTEQERFWSKVNRKDGGCWEWAAGRFSYGYGAFKRRVDGAWKQQKAHRLAYEWLVGPIPDGLIVCHACDNPPCCNPDHLFLGTQLDNQRDMIAKGRKGIHPRTLPRSELARRKRERHKDWRDKQREHLRQWQRDWKANHPEAYRASVERRRIKRREQRAAARQRNAA